MQDTNISAYSSQNLTRDFNSRHIPYQQPYVNLIECQYCADIVNRISPSQKTISLNNCFSDK